MQRNRKTRYGRADQVYQKVKELTFGNRSNNAQRGIESKDDEILTDPNDIKNRWKEYIEILNNKDGRPTELSIEEESGVDKYEIGPNIMRAEYTGRNVKDT